MMSYRGMKEKELAASITEKLGKEQSPYERYKDLSEEELFAEAEVNASDAEKSGYSNYSYWGSTVQTFLQNRVAVFFLVVLALLLAFTFIQPLLPNQRSAKTINNDPETGIQIINRDPDS